MDLYPHRLADTSPWNRPEAYLPKVTRRHYERQARLALRKRQIGVACVVLSIAIMLYMVAQFVRVVL